MAKKRMVSSKDRVSELSIDLIGYILERMSTRDAVRTSVLSKKWRYIWASHPQLVLGKQFFWEVKPESQSQFVRIIDKIFLLHNGPIEKFILHIPFCQSPDMDIWMLILSRNRIKELTIDNAYVQPYKLPSYIFSCAELTYLSLCNCIILNRPLEFRGFLYLKSLGLQRISISPSIGSLISGLPALHTLFISSCTGIENLKVLPPKLNSFAALNSIEYKWQCFKSNSRVSVLVITLHKEVQNVYEKGKHLNLMTLLASLPRLVTLCLNGYSLKFLSAGIVSQGQPFFNIEVMKLVTLPFNDLDQVSCAICLLRSSPNLQKLKIYISVDANEAIGVVNYMEAEGNSDLRLNRLQTVYLRYFNGSKAEVLFTKLLLSCSPSLERMVIKNRSGIDAKEGLRISTQLIQFHRASTKAQIVYLP